MLTLLPRLARWLLRNHEHPRLKCQLCYSHSQNHPAGPLARYTTIRLAGIPVCERHTLKEFAETMK